MMFRRSLIDLVFPDDDETFRLHMDFYIVVMAQMVAGSLLIDEALYSYRLHGRNGAADNPVLGGRLHLSSRNWGDTHGRMLDRMLSAMVRDRERFVLALGDRQYRRMVLRMRAARVGPLTGMDPDRPELAGLIPEPQDWRLAMKSAMAAISSRRNQGRCASAGRTSAAMATMLGSSAASDRRPAGAHLDLGMRLRACSLRSGPDRPAQGAASTSARSARPARA